MRVRARVRPRTFGCVGPRARAHAHSVGSGGELVAAVLRSRGIKYTHISTLYAARMLNASANDATILGCFACAHRQIQYAGHTTSRECRAAAALSILIFEAQNCVYYKYLRRVTHARVSRKFIISWLNQQRFLFSSNICLCVRECVSTGACYKIGFIYLVGARICLFVAIRRPFGRRCFSR